MDEIFRGFVWDGSALKFVFLLLNSDSLHLVKFETIHREYIEKSIICNLVIENCGECRQNDTLNKGKCCPFLFSKFVFVF
ncbi:MAG: hypothetical protein ACKPKO_14890, partial [Candidatus Fonsibacter sp.]